MELLDSGQQKITGKNNIPCHSHLCCELFTDVPLHEYMGCDLDDVWLGHVCVGEVGSDVVLN